MSPKCLQEMLNVSRMSPGDIGCLQNVSKMSPREVVYLQDVSRMSLERLYVSETSLKTSPKTMHFWRHTTSL